MNQKDRNIEETLEMANRIERVTPSDDLINRLKSIPVSVKQGYDTVPKKVIWMAAASIALLICLNFISFNNYQESKSDTTTQTEEDSYFSYMKNV